MFRAILIVALFLMPFVGSADVVAERRAQLEAELARIEGLIAEQQQLLDNKARERTTLERDIAILDAQIKKSELQIQALR